MLVTQFRKVYDYNSWAWDQVLQSLAQLDTAAYRAERPFFWGSLHSLTLHGMAAEWVWLRRIHGESPDSLPAADAYATVEEVQTAWADVRAEWQHFLGTLQDDDLQRVIEYRNTRGHGFSLTLADILQHVANHGTEHRSQMTPVLYELGVPTKPLDYMRYCLRP